MVPILPDPKSTCALEDTNGKAMQKQRLPRVSISILPCVNCVSIDKGQCSSHIGIMRVTLSIGTALFLILEMNLDVAPWREI